MMVPAALQEVLQMFASVDDPADRANLLIGYADQFKPVPPDIATRPYPAECRVPYCESDAYVWLLPQEDGTATLQFAVENPSGVSAKALAAILASTLSGLTPAAIAEVSPDIVEQIFRQNISMGKGMGLMAIVQAVRALARRASEGSRVVEPAGPTPTPRRPE